MATPPPDDYDWLRQGDSYTSSATTCTNSSSTTSASTSGTFYDEGSTDSNAWYMLNASTECIAPGTMVQMAGPGQIIPVRSMDDLMHDPRLVEERNRRMRREMAEIQSRMEREVSARIGGSYQRGAQPRTAAEVMLLAQQEQQQAQVRRLERNIERASGLPQRLLPSWVPPEAVPVAIREGEEAPVQQEEYRTMSRTHLELMRQEQERIQERYLAEQQRRFVMQQAMMEPGSINNNVNPHFGVIDDVYCGEPVPIPLTNEHMKKREKAEERAQELLGMIIGEEDLGVYKKTGNLYVKGKKYEYIIQKDGYILQLKEDRVVNLCVHLEKKNAMPLTDNVIAMKLRIENEEKDVLKLANKWGECGREQYQLPECAGRAA